MSEQRDGASQEPEFSLEGLFGDPEPAGDEEQNQQPGEGEAEGGDQGEEEPEPRPEGEQEAEPEATGKVKMVPFAALEEARQRARDAEAKLASKTTEEPEAERPDTIGLLPVRDPKEDPEGWAEDVAANQAIVQMNHKLEMSSLWAVKEHGEEVFKKVQAWGLARFDKDSDFAVRILSSADPYGTAIKEYNEEQERAKFADLPEEIRKGLSTEELELIRKFRAGESRTEGPSEEPNSPRAANGQFEPRKNPSPPRRSLAAVAGAGGKTGAHGNAAGPGQAFDDTFK